MVEILPAKTTDYKHIANFYLAFIDWLKQTYPEIETIMSPFYAIVEAEAATLPSDYVPPSGKLFLATYNNIPAGTVAYIDLGENLCEMRRMYVDPQFRGKQIGRKLAEMLLSVAKEDGFIKMRLDTGPRHYAALKLYESLGFEVTPKGGGMDDIPEGLPEDLHDGVIAMERDLSFSPIQRI